MKDFIYSNFLLTRATGVATMFTVEGVRVEMRKSGGPGAAQPNATKKKAQAKAKRARKPTTKASATPRKRPRKRAAATASKAAVVGRTETAPE